MTRYVLTIDLEPGAVLELSTGSPHRAEIVDISRALSTRDRTQRQPATRTDSDDLEREGRLEGRALPIALAIPREPTLTEDELFKAHGWCPVVIDHDE